MLQDRPSSQRVRQGMTRISLRGLLVIFLVAPPVGWFWWRLPIREEIVLRQEPSPFNAHSHRRGAATLPDGREYLIRPFLILGPPLPNVSLDPYFEARRRQTGFYRREVRQVRRRGLQGMEQDGPSRMFNQAGRLVVEEGWRDDKLQGPYRYWDEEGTLRGEGEFRSGRRHGRWRYWNRGGQIDEVAFYNHGAPAGVHLRYRNGKPLLMSRFRDGVLRERRQFIGENRVLSQLHDSTEELARYRELLLNVNGKEIELARTEFREGVRHGKMISRRSDGSLAMSGQWKAGTPVGSWSFFDETETPIRTVEYDGGFIARINDREVLDGKRFLVDVEDPSIYRIQKTLDERTAIKFVETPLAVVLDYLRDLHGVGIRCEPSLLLTPDGEERRISSSLKHAPFGLTLMLLLDEQDLTYTYRFDSLQVTTPEDAMHWQDRSGIAELVGSPLREAMLEQRTTLSCRNAPLVDVLQQISSMHGLQIRLGTEVESRVALVGLSEQNLRLRSLLGVLLNRHGLVCRGDESGIMIDVRPETDADEGHPPSGKP